ncbi:MAG: aminotransferase class I/II-fold pyridoxal phosphate-dependent enzyme [Thermoproteales archaeon]|nr:aminotransferase class I/II-fold pyridoxal phosphate-dependent enzyme [Thermoproteales archaeon]
MAERLPLFSLERWQSERENYAKILLSESGVEPFTLSELEKYVGNKLFSEDFTIDYGWTHGSLQLREKICGLYNADIKPENILVTCGGAEANFLAVLSLIRKGDPVIVEMPNYMQIHGLLKWIGAKVYGVWRRPENGFGLDIGEIRDLAEKVSAKAIFITNPNNPTGKILSRKDLEELSDFSRRKRCILVFDEAYRGLEHNGSITPSVIEINDLDYSVVTSTLSKTFALPGLRIGWLIARESVVKRAWSIHDYTTIAPAKISDHLATLVLEPEVAKKIRERCLNIVLKNKNYLERKLKEKPKLLEVAWPEAGAFFLAKLMWTNESLEVCQRIFLKKGILIVPGECFNLKGYIRVGMGQRPEKYVKALDELFKALDDLRGLKLKV